MQHPDRVGIIYAISKRLHERIDRNSRLSQAEWDAAVAKVPPVFDEYRYRPPAHRRHDVEAIYQFIHHVFVMAQMPEACDVPIFALMYLDRLEREAGIVVLSWCWRPLVFCALVVASKVWDDESMWNRSFAKIYPMFSLREINRMEAEFLQRLDYRMTINAVDYTGYYFQLQDEAGEHVGTAVSDPSVRTPLDKEAALKLEIMSSRCEATVQKQRTMRRWDSMKISKRVDSTSHTITIDNT